jgi:sugar fermentation stimulation protein A
MDSNAPNKVFAEWLNTSGYFKDITLIRPETTFENSRFDFYLEAGGEKIFIEVKGVTLEDGGIVRFPDAPTERGVKHIRELIRCKSLGFGAYIAFVIQMENVRYFEPNRETNPELADALIDAVSSGVGIIAFDCRVSPETLTANAPVEVRLN